MTLEQLIARFRRETKDEALPYLWTDADVVSFLNRALNRLALPPERGGAGYFLDRATWASLSVAANDPVIPDAAATTPQPSLAPIIMITRARLVGVSRPLDVISVDELEQGLLYEDYGTQLTGGTLTWETATGVPLALLTDYTDGLRLYPIPTQAYTLALVAYRTPLVPLVEADAAGGQDWKLAAGVTGVGGALIDDDEQVLIAGIKALAYAVDDADTYREDLAEKFMREFEQGVEQIAYRLRRRRHPPRAVRPNQDYL